MTALKYSAAALALLFASSMAYAEDSTNTTSSGKTEATDTQSTTQSGTSAQTGTSTDSGAATTESGTTAQTGTETDTDSMTTGTTGKTTEVPKTGTSTDTSSSGGTSTTTTGDMATTATTEANSFMASQFMGQIVYSAANENVGEINDLILDKEKGTVTAIVGVGGFLGIGEKDVAIPLDQITIAKDESNNMLLTIASTKEQLEAAPAFDRTAQY